MAKRLLAHPKVTVLWNSEPVEAKGDGVSPAPFADLPSPPFEIDPQSPLSGPSPIDRCARYKDRRDV